MQGRIRFLLGTACLAVTATASAATFTVNDLGDAGDATPGDTICATAGGVCTLRAAMDEANSTAGADIVTFSVAGTITIGSMIEATNPITLDGTTAPGYTNAPVVGLDGVDGLSITCLRINHMPLQSSTIRGFAFMRCGTPLFVPQGMTTFRANWVGLDLTGTAIATPAGSGVLITSFGGLIENNVFAGCTGSALSLAGDNTKNTIIRANRFGTAANGTGSLGNSTAITVRVGATMNTIGGNTVADGNLIANSVGSAIFLDDVTGNTIANNKIGADVNNMPAGNGRAIFLSGTTTLNTIRNNIIVNSTESAIFSTGTAGSVISQNLLGDNGGLAIDLGNDGVTQTGTPVIAAARDNGTATRARGTLSAATNTTYTIELFGSNDCDASGYGEGADYLGSTTVTTDANGNASFLASGTRTTIGQVITATATRQGGDTSELSQCQQLTACPAMTMNPTLPTPSTTGMFYAEPLSTTGGAGDYGYTVIAGALPDGLEIDSGVLVGVPQEVGTFTFTIQSQDINGCLASEEYSFTIGCGTVNVIPTMFDPFVLGMSFHRPIEASGGKPPYTATIVAGALPAGMSIMNNALVGTPTAAGSSTFTIGVTDANSCTGQREYTASIACGTVALDPISLPGGDVDVIYRAIVQALGATDPVYTLSGDLPPGVTFDPVTGSLTGTPTTAGTYTFTVSVVGADTCEGSRTYTITIAGRDAGCCDAGGDPRGTLLLVLFVYFCLPRSRRFFA